MSKFITIKIYYCCSGWSATKYFPFQNVIVNIHVLWLPTKRRTVHKKVSEPGLLGCTLLREQFRSDIPFVSEMYERRRGKMGVPSGDSTTPLIKIRFYQQREQDLEPHIYCKEKWKHSKLFNFQWTQIDLCIEYRYVCTSVLLCVVYTVLINGPIGIRRRLCGRGYIKSGSRNSENRGWHSEKGVENLLFRNVILCQDKLRASI